MRLAALVMAALLCATAASADDASKRFVPGHSMQLNGLTLDTSAPVYAPPVGNYSVLYSGSANPNQGTDDFSILDCGKNNTANVTYTFPQISSSVFPIGHGAAVKNSGSSFLCTVTATTSTISGAGGVVSGNPAAVGGPIVLYPGGEVTLISNGANYQAVGFVPGVWYQFANNVASLQWTGLSGYPELDLHCSGLMPVTTKDVTLLQIAFNGTFQSSGYAWTSVSTFVGATSVSPPPAADSASPGPSTAFELTTGPDSPSDLSAGAGATIQVHLTFADGTGAGFRRAITATASYAQNQTEILFQNFGGGPRNIVTESITGIQIFNGSTGSNLRTGLCWLKPSL